MHFCGASEEGEAVGVKVRNSFQRRDSPARGLARDCYFGKEEMRGHGKTSPGWGATCCAPTKKDANSLKGEGEEFEVPFAGEDNGEEAAIGGDAEFSDGDTVENGARVGLEDGDVFAGWLRQKRWEGDPDEVAGFSLDSTLEQNAGFVERPAEDTEANAKANKIIGESEVADFEDFAVDEVSDFFAARGDRKAAGVTVERSDFLVVLGEEFEALESRRTGLRAVLLDGDGGVGAGDAVGVDESAAFEGGTGGAGGDVRIAE